MWRIGLLALALGCRRAPVDRNACRRTDDTTRVVILPGSSVRAVRATGTLTVRVRADTEVVIVGRPTPTDTLILTPNAWQGSPEVRIPLATCR